MNRTEFVIETIHLMASIAMILFFLLWSDKAYAADQILSPIQGAVVTDDATDFVFTTDNGGNYWAMFGPDGLGVCGDTIAGYGGGVTRSFTGWGVACGGSYSTLGNGLYHIVTRNGSGSECTFDSGDYTSCLASGDYDGQDVCVDVGNVGGCPTPPTPPPSPSTASSTPVTGEQMETFLAVIAVALSIQVVLLTAVTFKAWIS